MDDGLLEKVADGRVFTGRQAVELKLVDQIGDEKAAVAWLVAQKGVKADLPVRDYKLSPRFGDLTFLRTAAAVTLDALGLSGIARQIEQTGCPDAVHAPLILLDLLKGQAERVAQSLLRHAQQGAPQADTRANMHVDRAGAALLFVAHDLFGPSHHVNPLFVRALQRPRPLIEGPNAEANH
jgi:ClpP class serine protease